MRREDQWRTRTIEFCLSMRLLMHKFTRTVGAEGRNAAVESKTGNQLIMPCMAVALMDNGRNSFDRLFRRSELWGGFRCPGELSMSVTHAEGEARTTQPDSARFRLDDRNVCPL